MCILRINPRSWSLSTIRFFPTSTHIISKTFSPPTVLSFPAPSSTHVIFLMTAWLELTAVVHSAHKTRGTRWISVTVSLSFSTLHATVTLGTTIFGFMIFSFSSIVLTSDAMGFAMSHWKLLCKMSKQWFYIPQYWFIITLHAKSIYPPEHLLSWVSLARQYLPSGPGLGLLHCRLLFL